MFPIPLKVSQIPRITAMVNNQIFPLPVLVREKLLLLGSAIEVTDSLTRFNHTEQASKTAALFAQIVMSRVFNLEGLLSIHLPIVDDRHKAANVLQIPLVHQVSQPESDFSIRYIPDRRSSQGVWKCRCSEHDLVNSLAQPQLHAAQERDVLQQHIHRS